MPRGRCTITGGAIAPRAASMFERQQAFIREQDGLRGLLLSDPRGGVIAAVNLITSGPSRAEGGLRHDRDRVRPLSPDVRVNATPCTVTAALETGMIPMTS